MKIAKKTVLLFIFIMLIFPSPSLAGFVEKKMAQDEHLAEIDVSSSRVFIAKLYDEVSRGNYHFLDELDFENGNGRETLKYMIQMVNESYYKIKKIEFEDVHVKMKDPLIIEVIVKEFYEIGSMPPFFQRLFVLKKAQAKKWTILDVTEPGL